MKPYARRDTVQPHLGGREMEGPVARRLLHQRIMWFWEDAAAVSLHCRRPQWHQANDKRVSGQACLPFDQRAKQSIYLKPKYRTGKLVMETPGYQEASQISQRSSYGLMSRFRPINKKVNRKSGNIYICCLHLSVAGCDKQTCPRDQFTLSRK